MIKANVFFSRPPTALLLIKVYHKLTKIMSMLQSLTIFRVWVMYIVMMGRYQ